MSLAAGTRVGRYRIVAKIGAGGMGEVFRARDVELQRDVALKVLPDDFAGDHDPSAGPGSPRARSRSDRLARFQREAVVLASLNHPNIAQIHGVENVDAAAGSGLAAARALVLEFVDGPTLAERIAAGPMPIEEALTIARQIVDALGAAHEAGVVHRDLKPANVKLRPDGVVKVLDFGLARVVAPHEPTDLTDSATLTSPGAAEHGAVVGTAAYMAPEQARGQAVDQRADIWAFGVVLYEMLTGRRPFIGDDVLATLAAVIAAQPDLDAVPARVRRLVARCLEKDPRRRLRDIHDAWDLVDEHSSGRGDRPRSARRWWAAAAVVALAGAAFALGMRVDAPDAPSATAVRRLQIALPDGVTLPAAGPQVVLSPDGQTLVFRAQSADGVMRLYRRPLGALAAAPIAGTENVRYQGPPIFSPDGQWLAFLVGSRLQKVNLGGGHPELIAELPRGAGVFDRTGWNWGGGAWGADGTIVLALFEAGLVRVPAAGGDVEVIVESDGLEHWYQHPQILDDGRAILFTSTMAQHRDEIRIFDTRTQRTTSVIRGGAGRLLPTGHLVFVRGGALWAVGFDRDRLEIVGEPKPVEPGVRHGAVGTAWLSVANDGSLAYVSGPFLPRPIDVLVWVDRAGVETPVDGFPPRQIGDLRLSRAGDRVALTVWEGDSSVHLWDFSSLVPLTPRGAFHRLAVMSPDGRHLAYAAQEDGREDVHTMSLDLPAEPRRFLPLSERGRVPMTFSPDGRHLVLQTATQPAMIEVFELAGGVGSPATLVGSFEGRLPSISRDGRWIAYESGAENGLQAWVRPFPDVNGRGTQVSATGGIRPVWSPGTDELFFLVPGQPRRLHVIDTGGGRTPPEAWTGRPLFAADQYVVRIWRHYDVAPDGTRFLFAQTMPQTPAPPPGIVVVERWFDELNRLVPLK